MQKSIFINQERFFDLLSNPSQYSDYKYYYIDKSLYTKGNIKFFNKVVKTIIKFKNKKIIFI